MLLKNGQKNDKESLADIVKDYTNRMYSNINKQLQRLSEYENKPYSFDFFNSSSNLIHKLNHKPDIVIDNLNLHIKNWWFNTNYTRATEYIQNDEINDYILSMDYYFQKYGTKSKTEEIYHRGMIEIYPYLIKLNDKMVLETYTSTSTEWGSFIPHVDVHYKIIVSPNIPRIDTLKDVSIKSRIYYPDEKEVILPRNLLAELTHIDDSVEPPIHTIKVTPLYENQFELKKKNMCKNSMFIPVKLVSMLLISRPTKNTTKLREEHPEEEINEKTEEEMRTKTKIKDYELHQTK